MRNPRLRFRALGMVLVLVLLLTIPAYAAGDNGKIYINDAKDLIELAQNCTLNTWSQDKTVILNADISMENTDFTSIPSFGGTFKGNGHTISGLMIDGNAAPAGLFAYLQETAEVNRLNVEGNIIPSGDGAVTGGIAGENNGLIRDCSFQGTVSSESNTGGIAGTNTASGKIIGCRSSGAIFGEYRTGGITGYNMGIVDSCENHAYVNITSVDPSVRLDEINLDFMLNITNITSLDTGTAASDTGGIAGYSAGMIVNCTNQSPVGYQHIGYNVGGIAGRSCGYISNCENQADIYGRKDVGGIVGQIEPYIEWKVTEDSLSELKSQLDDLNTMVNETLNDSAAASGTVYSRLNQIADFTESAAAAADNIKPSVSVIYPEEPEIPSLSDPEELEIPSLPDPEELEIPSLPEISIDKEVKDAVNDVTSAVNGICGQMRMLNSEVAGVSNSLTDDLKAINNQINLISDTVFDLMSGTDENGILEDTSEIDIDAVIFGKTSAVTNSGSVYGDISVGGIAGALSIEYELDPEDDVTASISENQRKNYEMKAILQNCVNTGSITSKRSYAGGICGRMELGYVTDCENYGDIESENGDYVGGIAGNTSSTIHQSYAKCTLRGNKYIGGITGLGAEDTNGEAASRIIGCYSLVSIPEHEQYAGAIAGDRKGAFTDNYFVSDELQGMNGLSYSGMAEPVAFSELMVKKDPTEDEPVHSVPESFMQFCLDFVVDEKTVKSVSFSYGDSFDETVYPVLPKKEGCYGYWDTAALDRLHFDTIVTAVYKNYNTSLDSEEQRSSGRPVFFVQGAFQADPELTVTARPDSPDEFDGLKDGFWETVKKCFTSRSLSREIVEQWELRFSSDGNKIHTIRYLAPDENPKHLTIYIKTDDGWEMTETEEIGSYLAFEAEGTDIEMAVITTIPIWWIWLIVAFILLVVFLLLLRMVKKCRKRRTLKKAAKSRKDKERKKIKWLIPLLILLALLTGVGISAAFFLLPDLMTDIRIYDLLKKQADRREYIMEVELESETGSGQNTIKAVIDKQQLDQGSVICIETGGVRLYYANGIVFLENGRAYQVGDTCPDYSGLLTQTAELYRLVDLSVKEENQSYSITAEGDEARKLLELLLPDAVNEMSDTQTITADLNVEEKELKQIHLSAQGSLNDSKQTGFSVSAVMTMKSKEEKHAEIPEKVKEAIKDGVSDAEMILTQDLINLAEAWEELDSRNSMSAGIQLHADCGPIIISDSLELYRQTRDSLKISSVLKNGYALYFTDNTICDKDGKIVVSTDTELIDNAKILDIIYELCMNGKFDTVKGGKECTYSLSLDEEGMKAVACAIAPGAEDMDILFDTGTILITTENNILQSIRISCEGSVHIMLSDLDVSFGADILFHEGEAEYTVPEQVYKLLNSKEGEES